MKLTDTILDGLVIISIDGDLDHANIGVLNDLLAAHLTDGNHPVLFDLKACSFIDSAGLGALMNLQRDLRDKGGVAVAGANPHVRRLLDIVGLLGTDGFELFDDMADAGSSAVARV